jgi:hypothetical protein
VLALLALAYRGFFSETYFTLDDFEWMCFCKFHPEPLTVLWRDTLSQQFFRPVGELWYMAIYTADGNEVLPYQIGFLVVHLLNGVLAGWLASRLGDPALGRYVALVFTLNAVFMTYISLRFYFIFDTLGFSFHLVSLAFLILAQSKRPVLYGTISLAAALVGYFTREAYFTLPGAAVLVLGTRPGEGWSWHLLTSALALAAPACRRVGNGPGLEDRGNRGARRVWAGHDPRRGRSGAPPGRAGGDLARVCRLVSVSRARPPVGQRLHGARRLGVPRWRADGRGGRPKTTQP